MHRFEERRLSGALLAAIVLFTLSAPGLSRVKQYAGLTKSETLKQKAIHRGKQLGYLTVVKLNDHYKWRRKLMVVNEYERRHPVSPVVQVLNHRRVSCSAQFEVLTEDGNRAWMTVSFPLPGAVRVRAGLADFPAEGCRGGEFSMELSGDTVTLTGPGAGVQVGLKPFRLSVHGAGGGELIGGPDGSGLALGQGRCRQAFVIGDDEMFIGGGEQYGQLNHRGKVLIMDTDDAFQSNTGNTYIPVPFFLSSRGYGLLLNTFQMAKFDFGKDKSDRLVLDNPNSNIDYYLFLSDDPKRIMEQYSSIAGRSYVIPRWALEPWISRRTFIGWKYDAGAEQDVQTMLDEGFPLGVVMYENMTMTSDKNVDFRTNRETKPRMPEIIDYWHGLGIKVAGYMQAGCFKYTPETLAYYGLDRHPEYLVRNPDGPTYVGGYGGGRFYLDTTNPEAMEYAWEVIFKPMFMPGADGGSSFERMNLDGTKVDFGEYFPGDEVPLLMADRVPGMRLCQPTWFSEWLYLKLNELRPGGGVTWVRGAGLGAQRTGMVWAGDRNRTFSQLRTTIIAGLNAAASGVSLWGTDLGGYTGGGIMAEEVYNRSAAFSCFSPSFHDHGSAIAPWEQTGRGKDIYRYYARLRYNLIPYIYHLVWEAHLKGLPVIRPMFFEYPDDDTCWRIDDQYFLGDHILVAPVVENAKKRKVYLPSGDWVDFFTREEFRGPIWLNYEAPREKIPVFVRSGSAIPSQFNSNLEPGGGFDQVEKGNLTPGFMVFGGDHLEIDAAYNVFDPRKRPDVESSIRIRREGEDVLIDDLTPLPAGVLVYGVKSAGVLAFGRSIKQVSRDDVSSARGDFWFYRGEDDCAVIYISKE